MRSNPETSGLEESTIITAQALAALEEKIPLFSQTDIERAKDLATFIESELLPHLKIKFRKKSQPQPNKKSQIKIATNLAASATAFFADAEKIFVVNSSDYLDLLRIISHADLKERELIVASIYNPHKKSFISVVIDLKAKQITVTDSDQLNDTAHASNHIINHLFCFLKEKFAADFEARITGSSALKSRFALDEVQSAFYCALNNIITIYKINRKSDEQFTEKLHDFFAKNFSEDIIQDQNFGANILSHVSANLTKENLGNTVICYAALYDAIIAPQAKTSAIHDFLVRNNNIFDLSELVATIVKFKEDLDFKGLNCEDFYQLNSDSQELQKRNLLWYNQIILTPDLDFRGPPPQDYFKIESDLAQNLSAFIEIKKAQNAQPYFNDPEIAQEALAFVKTNSVNYNDGFEDLEFDWIDVGDDVVATKPSARQLGSWNTKVALEI